MRTAKRQINFRTPSRQRGQIIVMMMVAIIPALLLIAFVFNGGTLVAHKTKLQNTADTAALTEAAWTARTLNIMAMNNTGLAQAHAVASSAWALEGPLYKSLWTADAVRGFFGGRIIAWWKEGISKGGWVGAIIAAIATIFFGALIAFISTGIIPELNDIKDEVERAIHQPTAGVQTGEQNPGAFARAAAAMGHMNKLLVESAPAAINEFSTSQTESNFEGAEAFRFTAWAPDGIDTDKIVIPVKELSFQNLTSKASVENLAETALAAKDIDNAGKEGTTDNPWTNSFNYFGNFNAHGYKGNDGPFNLAQREIMSYFPDKQKIVEEWADGTYAPKAVKVAICGVMDKVGFSCKCGRFNFICKFVKGIAEALAAIFATLAGTIFQDPKMKEDLSERLSETWQWTTLYREATYSNAKYTPVWPALIGLYHGYDLTNYADIAGAQFDAAGQTIEDGVKSIGDAQKIQECFDERVKQAEAAKEAEYNQEVEEAIANGEDPPPRPSFELTNSEKESIEEDCEKEVEDNPDLYTGTSTDTGTIIQPEYEGTEFEDTSDNPSQEEQDANSNKDYWPSIREYLTWPYEALGWVLGVKLPMPLDAWPLINTRPSGSIDSVTISDYTCRGVFPSVANFIPSGICTHETPFFYVPKIRLAPENPVSFSFTPPRIAFSSQRVDWSTLVAVKRGLELPLASKTFTDMPDDIVAIAQAEIYNTQWFDDFTQRWQAKLVPVTLIEDQDYLPKIMNQWKNDLKVNELFPLVIDPNQHLLNH